MNAVLDGLPLEQTDLGLEFENSDAKCLGRSASGIGKLLEFENADLSQINPLGYLGRTIRMQNWTIWTRRIENRTISTFRRRFRRFGRRFSVVFSVVFGQFGRRFRRKNGRFWT